MATLKPFPDKITGLNETQAFITRTILSQKIFFTQEDILKEVSEKCLHADSWKVTNMVLETLEYLIELGKITEVAGKYSVQNKNICLKTRLRFE